jgi:hypothetical protein
MHDYQWFSCVMGELQTRINREEVAGWRVVSITPHAPADPTERSTHKWAAAGAGTAVTVVLQRAMTPDDAYAVAKALARKE